MLMQKAFKETKIHGRLDFPYVVYIGLIPEGLTSFPLHWHKEFEIIYIHSGCGTIFVDSKSYDCRYGDILLVPPDTIHGINQKNNEKMVYFNILFQPSLLEADQDSSFYKKYCLPLEEGQIRPPVLLTPDTKASRQLRPLIEPLTEHWNEAVQENVLFVKAKMFPIYEIIYGLSEKSAGGSKKVTASSRFKPLLSYVSANYNEAISIKKAAELCNYSEAFFMKSFKKTFGITFNSYLNEFRLEKAQDYLKNTDMNVSQVSNECGFESLSYFIKCFRKKWGVTPHTLKKSRN